ncbi:MAG: 3-deoxy-8-phosphooctulonate synthase [Bryobacterales bacterium]
MEAFSIGDVQAGGGKLFAICGPCVIESEEHAVKTALALRGISSDTGVPLIFKASYDKANRTSASSYRGPGLEEGLRILAEVKRETGMPVLTDVHETVQIEPVAAVCDVLQIPAFLCRQTDLLLTAGRTGRAINIKKGQFLSPWDFQHAGDKVASTGNQRILLTERGASFGYNNLVVDFRGLQVMRGFGYPTVLDVTHSLQLPGAGQGASSGQPEFIETLARAGAAAGVDGLFFEVHQEPAKALSDGANALRLDKLAGLLERLRRIHELIADFPTE